MSGRWLAGKAAAALVTFVFVLVFNFFLFRVMGDPTTQLAKLPQATPKELAKLRADYGLDKPLLGQFVDYVGDTARFDLGVSQRSRRPVWDEIAEAQEAMEMMAATQARASVCRIPPESATRLSVAGRA